MIKRESMGKLSWLLLGAVLLLPVAAIPAQPKAEIRKPEPIDPETAAREGRELVKNLLADRPETPATNEVTILFIDAQDKERKTAARFAVAPGVGGWQGIYELPGSQPEVFVVTHRDGATNDYCYASGGVTNHPAGNELTKPFAGSDFWLVDLSLDFLHWPVQRIIRKQMARGQFCHVLESVNPSPAPQAYSRVTSWIAINREGVAIVQAQAYDGKNKLLKEFSPKNLEKVRGQYQLQEMEMLNRQTGTRTKIQFQFSPPEAQ